MRIWPALALLIALSGCVPATAPPEAGEIAEATLPPPVDGETGTDAPDAEPDAPPEPAPSEPAPQPEPPFLARQRAACLETGGQLMPRANGFFTCVQQTRDAGRRCDAASDCEGLCLARSGTCAPLHPLFGCQEVFTLPGRRETLCTD